MDDDPGLTVTYFTAKSNLVTKYPYMGEGDLKKKSFNWEKYSKWPKKKVMI